MISRLDEFFKKKKTGLFFELFFKAKDKKTAYTFLLDSCHSAFNIHKTQTQLIILNTNFKKK
jgi:hypothetical protein